jgi:hypothetical protein
MRTFFARVGVWLFVFLIVSGLNAAAYTFFVADAFDPDGSRTDLATGCSDVALLGTCFVSFLLAGIAVAWHMRGSGSAIPWAMALGCVWLATDIAFQFPWYQMFPAHPSPYDHLIAFVGAICAPAASALGAVAYREWLRRAFVANTHPSD